MHATPRFGDSHATGQPLRCSSLVLFACCFLLAVTRCCDAAASIGTTAPLQPLYTSPFNSFPMAGETIQYRQGLATTATPGVYAMTLQPSTNHTFALGIIHYFTTHNKDGQQNVPAFTYDQGFYYPVELIAGDLLAWSFTLVDYNSQQGDTVVLTIQTANADGSTPAPTPAASTVAPTTVATSTAPPTVTPSATATPAATSAAPKTAAPSTAVVPSTQAPTTTPSPIVPTIPATTPAAPIVTVALTSGSIATSTSNVFLGNTPVVDSNVAARELFLSNRLTTAFSKLATMDSYAAMDALNRGVASDDNMMYVMANGGTNTTNATHRLGAEALLQVALFQNQPQHLPAAISQVQLDIVIRIGNYRAWVAAGNNPNNDVIQRVERGALAYACWLLHQAGVYFVAAPGQAPTGSVQQLMEAFSADMMEAYAPSTVWLTAGYNKEIAQDLQPAFMLAIYQAPAFSKLYPLTYVGFNKFWTAVMGGAGAAYEPDNTPEYKNFNIQMIFMMGLVLGRLVRTNATDPTVFVSDSWDIPRHCDNLVRELMPSGDTLNYNKAASNWITAPSSSFYAFNNPDNLSTFNLKICYTITGSDNHLWAARRLEQFLVTTGVLPVLPLPTEVYPSYIHHWERQGVQPSAALSNSSVSWFRGATIAQCGTYGGLNMCRGATQNKTTLVPNFLVLRTGISDDSAYAVVSLAVDGNHANQDQRLCLDNTLYRSAYTVSRAGRPQQQNQCNGPVAIQASTNAEFPVIQTNSTVPSLLGASYNLSYANATQLAGNIGYADAVYSTFMLANVSVRRQTLLLPNGVVAVRDTFTTNASLAYPVKVGTNWRLWPGITMNGSNWALQAPHSALNSTGSITSTPRNTTSTLFWVSPTAGRTFGYTSEPLSTWLQHTSSSQTVSNMYAYDVLGPSQSTQFLTLIAPVQTGNNVGQLAAAIASDAASLTVPYVIDGAATLNKLTLAFASLL